MFKQLLIAAAATQSPPPYIEYAERFRDHAEYTVTMIMCAEANVGDIRLTKAELNNEANDLVRQAVMDRIPKWYADQAMTDAIKEETERVKEIGFDDVSKDYWADRLSACFTDEVRPDGPASTAE